MKPTLRSADFCDQLLFSRLEQRGKVGNWVHMYLSHPEKGDQPRGSFPAGVLVRRPIVLSKAWLVFLLWTFATAVKISLPPLPACKGHVPEINPESPRPAPWLRIPVGTDVKQKPRDAGCALLVLEIPWPGVGLSPVPGSTSSMSWTWSYGQF